MKPDLAGLPGARRVEKGLSDLAEGRRTAEALLVTAASQVLRELGLSLPSTEQLEPQPELALYNLLLDTSDHAYGRYNSMRRELDSFIGSLSARQRRAQASERSRR